MSTTRRNPEVRRHVASHLFAVIAEWASLIGLLVYAFEHSGARATGLASIATLAPYVVFSSTTARLAHRHRPAAVRAVGLVAQALGYGLAAGVALSDGPLVVAVVGVAVAFTAVTSLRPSGAVLLPGLVRSSRELTGANVRIGYCESTSVLLGPVFATVLLEVGGGGMVLAGCSGLTVLAAVTSLPGVRSGPPAPPWPEQERRSESPAASGHGWFAPLSGRSTTSCWLPAGPTPEGCWHHGDRFHAVADGAFDIVMSGELVRTARRASTFGEVALLADVSRTATVIAREPGHLVAIDRAPFLTAVTGYDSSRQAAWGVVRSMSFDQEVPLPNPSVAAEQLQE